jgi:maltooligosyltrehalose trehalohydrolase
MEPVGSGTFATDQVPRHGQDYGFSLDSGPVVPDPRSPWQPNGVHGFSRGYDQDAFEWSTEIWHAAPLAGSVLYELHVGTFTEEGTFSAAVGKLDALVDLGITAVELMPVAQFAGTRGWGYDGVNLFAVNSAYGGPDGLKSFVDACHARHLGVILDVVYNHVGPEGNYLTEFGPYLTDRYKTPWGEAFNLDGRDSVHVRRFLIDNAAWWIRNFRVDGLRLDSVPTIIDTSEVHFLLELSRAVKDLEATLGRSVHLIAENLNDPRVVLPEEAGGYGIDAAWCNDFHHALHAFLTGERGGYYEDFGALQQLATAIRQGYVFTGQFSRYRGRFYGAPFASPDFRLVGYAQNHDQIGNRADGARLAELLSPALCRVVAGLTLLGPHIPMLFHGEEWAATTRFYFFTDYSRSELVDKMRAGRQDRYELFGWDSNASDPQAEATFASSKLDWEERARNKNMVDWYRELIRLRRSNPDLAASRFSNIECWHDPGGRWIAYRSNRTLVIANFSDSPITLSLSAEAVITVLATSTGGDPLIEDKALLDPQSLIVLSARGIAATQAAHE